MASPFLFAGELAADLCCPSPGSHIEWAVFWSLVYAMAAFAFLVATLATFNRCLGRVEVGLPRGHRWVRKAAKPARVVEIAGEAFDAP